MKKVLILPLLIFFSGSHVLVGAEAEKEVKIETQREKAKRAFLAAVEAYGCLLTARFAYSFAMPAMNSIMEPMMKQMTELHDIEVPGLSEAVAGEQSSGHRLGKKSSSPSDVINSDLSNPPLTLAQAKRDRKQREKQKQLEAEEMSLDKLVLPFGFLAFGAYTTRRGWNKMKEAVFLIIDCYYDEKEQKAVERNRTMPAA